MRYEYQKIISIGMAAIIIILLVCLVLPMFYRPAVGLSAKTRSILFFVKTGLECYYDDYSQYPTPDSGEQEPNPGSRALYHELVSSHDYLNLRWLEEVGAFADTPEGRMWVDAWGNPLVYFDSATCQYPALYAFGAGQEWVVVSRKARPATAAYVLYSVGPNGKNDNGSGDDVLPNPESGYQQKHVVPVLSENVSAPKDRDTDNFRLGE